MVIGVYVRVSSSQQIVEGESLDTQIDNGRRFCVKSGFEYEIYNEGSRSGGDKNRDTYNKLISDLRDGVLDGIWVFSTSRLNRESVESGLLIRECKELNKKFFVDNKEYDLDNDESRLMLSMISGFDEYFRSVNTFQSVQNKKRRLREGRWINGTILFGYKKNENGGLEINKIEMEVIESILGWYISGKSQKRIVSELFAKYGKENNVNGKTYKFNRSWVGKILRSRYYVDGGYRLGLKGEYFDFVFESGISEEIWKKANLIYKSTLKHKRKESISWLEGKITCIKCGGNLTLGVVNGYLKQDGSRKKYYYVSCRNHTDLHKHKEWSIPYKEVENDLIGFVDRYLLGENFIKDEIKSMIESEGLDNRNKEDENNGIPELIKQLEELEEKRKRLRILYLELQDMSKDDYVEMSKMVDEEIQSIKVELKGDDDRDEYIESVVDEWLNRIGELDIISGKQFLEEYVESIGIRVVKRDWFNNGRLIKYIFRFKEMEIDWKRVERELIGGKKNSINYLSNRTLNTNKIIINKRNQKICVEVVFNGFQYEIKKTYLK